MDRKEGGDQVDDPIKVCLLRARLQNKSGKKEEVKREKLARASAPGVGVVLHNCPEVRYLFLAQGTSCGSFWKFAVTII